MINVKDDFGAVGNAQTDDTAAIQAAFDTGRNVYIPRGRYKITQTLTVDHNAQKILGDGISSTRYGVYIRGGCSNYIVATNNLRGNSSQGLRDLGSGPKQTSLNLE